MYVKLDTSGKILYSAEWKVDETYIETNNAVLRGYDGGLYYEDELPIPPEPTEEEKAAALQAQYTAPIQSILDGEAQKLGYDNCLSVCSYVDTGVSKYDTEGKAFRQWRSDVWSKAFELLEQIKAGEATMPTEEELKAYLPELVIDYEAKGYTI